jgi:hypothetical protein
LKEEAALKIEMLILLCLKNNYGAMYNKYNTLIYADEKKQHLKRNYKIEWTTDPPDSYDLLAWSYLNMGQR